MKKDLNGDAAAEHSQEGFSQQTVEVIWCGGGGQSVGFETWAKQFMGQIPPPPAEPRTLAMLMPPAPRVSDLFVPHDQREQQRRWDEEEAKARAQHQYQAPTTPPSTDLLEQLLAAGLTNLAAAETQRRERLAREGGHVEQARMVDAARKASRAAQKRVAMQTEAQESAKRLREAQERAAVRSRAILADALKRMEQDEIVPVPRKAEAPRYVAKVVQAEPVQFRTAMPEEVMAYQPKYFTSHKLQPHRYGIEMANLVSGSKTEERDAFFDVIEQQIRHARCFTLTAWIKDQKDRPNGADWSRVFPHPVDIDVKLPGFFERRVLATLIDRRHALDLLTVNIRGDSNKFKRVEIEPDPKPKMAEPLPPGKVAGYIATECRPAMRRSQDEDRFVVEADDSVPIEFMDCITHTLEADEHHVLFA